MTHTEKVYIAGFVTFLACHNSQSINYLKSILTDLGVSWDEVDKITESLTNPSVKEAAYRELRLMGADDKKLTMMTLNEILTSCNMFDATI